MSASKKQYHAVAVVRINGKHVASVVRNSVDDYRDLSKWMNSEAREHNVTALAKHMEALFGKHNAMEMSIEIVVKFDYPERAA
ncbi:hypothetical protein [Xanthomonas phage SB3]|uniref:ASCH domain-containing protein n=1 Tax=Xanthomonas phage SB3 TaxID=3117472 RepID=A0ABZ2GWK4_9CAUD